MTMVHTTKNFYSLDAARVQAIRDGAASTGYPGLGRNANAPWLPATALPVETYISAIQDMCSIAEDTPEGFLAELSVVVAQATDGYPAEQDATTEADWVVEQFLALCEDHPQVYDAFTHGEIRLRFLVPLAVLTLEWVAPDSARPWFPAGD